MVQNSLGTWLWAFPHACQAGDPVWEANGKNTLLSYFLGNCVCLPFLIYLRTVRCVREMARHELWGQLLQSTPSFLSVQGKVKPLPSQMPSPLPTPPTHAVRLQQTHVHMLKQARTHSHTHLLENSLQHTLTHTCPQTFTLTCSLMQLTLAHLGMRAHTCICTHSYTQRHAYSCTRAWTPSNTHAHTHSLMHAHIRATYPSSYSYTITYTWSLTCILAYICKHILEHTRWHPGFFPRRGPEKCGIFQQKIVEYACCSGSGKLETE